jgi:hypothetical protein
VPTARVVDEAVASLRYAYGGLVAATERAGRPEAPVSWTVEEIKALRAALHARVRAEDRTGLGRAEEELIVLCDTVITRVVRDEIGVDEIPLERAQVLYRAAVGRWPDDAGGSVNLVTAAARAAMIERRERRGGALDALARFLLLLAAERGISGAPGEAPNLAEWIEHRDHSFGG